VGTWASLSLVRQPGVWGGIETSARRLTPRTSLCPGIAIRPYHHVRDGVWLSGQRWIVLGGRIADRQLQSLCTRGKKMTAGFRAGQPPPETPNFLDTTTFSRAPAGAFPLWSFSEAGFADMTDPCYWLFCVRPSLGTPTHRSREGEGEQSPVIARSEGPYLQLVRFDFINLGAAGPLMPLPPTGSQMVQVRRPHRNNIPHSLGKRSVQGRRLGLCLWYWL